MSIAALIRKMADAGAPPEAIALAVEAIEAAQSQVEAGRAAARDRKRRQRERSVTVTGQSRDKDGTVTSTPYPLPSSPQTPQQPTPTPENNTRSRKDRPAKPLPASTADLDRIWSAANQISRGRSGRPDTATAIAAALAKGGTLDAIEASVRQHCRASGDHPKGLHRIINAELWRDHLARPEPPASISPEYRRHVEQHFRQTGEWKPEWGEKPNQTAAA